MYNFNKKQKVILGVLTAMVVGFICYYVYAKEDKSKTQLELDNNLEIEEEEKEKEGYSDDVILVHVSGAVNQEGVVELKANGRISDAIDKAGGVREDAYTKDINLAYQLEDGMKIYIPTKQENENKNKAEVSGLSQNETESYVSNSSGISISKNFSRCRRSNSW